MRKTLKQTITAILAAAILITGISTGGTMTAHAATTVENFKQNGEATMKPGDVKKLLVMDKSGKDLVETYKWSSSDSSVLKVESDFVDDSVDFTCCVYVTALKNGTATITGKSIYGYQPLTMTVNVQLAKATAKQKKCKHTWKTTKKATCERTGIKTCKKCKLQESIAKKAHTWTEKTVYTQECWHIIHCNYCWYDENSIEKDSMTMCDLKVKVEDYSDYKNMPGYEDAGSAIAAAKRALVQLHAKTGANHATKFLGGYEDYEQPYGPLIPCGTETVCKKCGAKK